MSSDRYQELERLFHELLALSESERAARLESMADADQKEQLRDMLRTHLTEDSFLEPPTTSSPTQLLPQHLGNYRVIRFLDRGGQAQVWVGEHVSLPRKVAIKILDERLASSEAIPRHQNEAETQAALQHPGIATIYDRGYESGYHFIVMEFIEGRSLATILRERRKRRDGATPDPRIPLADLEGAEFQEAIVRIIIEVAEALDYCHGREVIHRDIKPGNIVIDGDGRARLIDFGLALAPDRLLRTVTGALAGTVHYMSPEQAALRRLEIDHRSDVFSLGVVLYEALTLKLPFEGDTEQDVLASIRSRHPTSTRRLNQRVSKSLENVNMKALEKRPEDRYPTAQAFADDLKRVQAGRSPLAGRPPLRERYRRYRSKHRTAARLMELGVCLLMAVILLWGYRQVSTYLALPSVTVRAYHPDGSEIDGATVTAQALTTFGWADGEPVALGETPLVRRRMDKGRYRITVEGTGVGYAELTREFDRPKREVLAAAVVRPTAGVVSPEAPGPDEPVGMVRIEGGSCLLNEYGPDWELKQVNVDGFWIDPYEVSNGQYARFLADTAHARQVFGELREEPPTWRAPRDPGWEELPVVGVSFEDARAYAEWAGKRLPTAAEWQRAARGTDGRRFPWGDERDEPPGSRAVYQVRRSHPLPTVEDGQWDEYLLTLGLNYQAAVAPVTSHGQGVSPDGLHHTLGNVEEWTDSVPLDINGDGRWHPVPGQRLAAGGGWRFEAAHVLLKWMAPTPMDQVNQNTIGFRCAKSRREFETEP